MVVSNDLKRAGGHLILELEGLGVLQRKLIVDLMRRKHPEFWTKFKQNNDGWKFSRGVVEQFIRQNSHEVFFSESLEKQACFMAAGGF